MSHIAILMVVLVLAQPQNAAFRNLTPAEGLPVTSVTDIEQDTYGFIWITSWDGTYRYDGQKFQRIDSKDNRKITPDNKGGMWISNEDGNLFYYDPSFDSLNKYEVPNGNRFVEVFVDSKDRVWVSSNNGILQFDVFQQSFNRLPNQKAFYPNDIFEMSDGTIVFGAYDESSTQDFIAYIDENGSISYEPIPLDPNRNHEVHLNVNTDEQITALSGNRLLFINEHGWGIKDLNTGSWTFGKPQIPGLLKDLGSNVMIQDDAVWFTLLGGVGKLDLNTGESLRYYNDRNNPNSLLPQGRNSGDKLFIDRQGILWITRFSYGVSRLNLFESDFGKIQYNDGRPVVDVISAFESPDGDLWIGSRISNYGLLHFDKNKALIESYGNPEYLCPPGKSQGKLLSHPFVWGIAQTSDGTVWARTASPGLGNGGLNKIPSDGGLITRYKHDPNDPNSIPANQIGNLMKDGKDRLWFLFWGRAQMSYFDTKTEIFYNYETPNDSIGNLAPIMSLNDGDILVGSRDYYWISGNGPHFILDHETLEVTPFARELDIKNLIIRYQDDEGRFWASNEEGFGCISTDGTETLQWFKINKLNLPIKEINACQTDKEGNIWLATENGIIKFNPENETFLQFGYSRGLQELNFTNRLGFYESHTDRIFFSGTGGVNVFHPNDIKTNPYPPEMVFLNVQLDDNLVDLSSQQVENLTIGPEVNSIKLTFSALHFAGYNENKYLYRLDGFDEEWRNGGILGTATYTNLPHGDYTFSIEGSNWDGVWSSENISMTITILPPWYLTNWAYAGYILLGVLFFYGVDKIQKERTIQKERERIKDERLAEAKEKEIAYEKLKATQDQLIHSEKMASLGELTAGIAHEIQNPLNFVNNFSDLNKDLLNEQVEELDKGEIEEAKTIAKGLIENEKKIMHHGKRAEEIVKSMLQHSRGTDGSRELTDLNALADEYLRLSYHGLRAKDKSFNAEFKCTLDDTLPKMEVIPQDIGRVLLNLINNAFHATAEKAAATNGYMPLVEVITKAHKDGIEILVKDNGPGISEEIRDKIFQPFFTTKSTGSGTGLGLSLSYDIITKGHGGTIEVDSELNKGTVFKLGLKNNS
jgi:signal transduction histidine kinase/streptogramin lyase